MKTHKLILILLMAFLFIGGLAVFTYPEVHGAAVSRELKSEAQSFLALQEFNTASAAPIESTESVEAEVPQNYPELWEAMQAYNDRIWDEKQSGLSDPWAYQQPAFTLGEYGIGNEIFGVISIPALDLEMPLYLGATPLHLSEGAAQLSQTSLPIGGKNTNCVIAGHRGWYGVPYFRYIDKLVPGDEVIITNMWETLTYSVTGTKIIMPNEVDQIFIQEGRDMVTLLSCHPYASGGKQRYLVFCDRVTDSAE